VTAVAIHRPTSLEEAVGLLDELGEDARIVAGSTAVSIMVTQGLIAPTALVGIDGLTGLSDIREVDGALEIGALVTHRAIEGSPIVRERVPVLSETFSRVANARVRNAATLGGVLAEADYASDPPAVLRALDASVTAVGPSGTRAIPLDAFFHSAYQTDLAPNEILTSVTVPVPALGTGAAYEKFVTRSSEDRPCVGVVALVRLDHGGATVAELRVAVAAAAETPQRFPDVEAGATGRSLGDSLVRAVADAYADRIDTLDDLRGSAGYRTKMVRVWVRRAIEAAAARAGRR
jgi:carbon-monoxide dehydrogenase medium subunit